MGLEVSVLGKVLPPTFSNSGFHTASAESRHLWGLVIEGRNYGSGANLTVDNGPEMASIIFQVVLRPKFLDD